MRPLTVSLRAFTRLSIAGKRGLQATDSPETVSRAIRYYPLIGALVGFVMTIVYLLGSLLLPHALAVVIALGVGLAIAGAGHEGGLAGTCDGLGGGRTRDDALRIMRDARIGAFGATGIVILLLLRFEALASIQMGWEGVAFVGSQALSRGLAVATMMTMPPARAAGGSPPEPLGGPVRIRDGLIAIALGLAPAVSFALDSGDVGPMTAAGGFAILIALLARWRIKRRLDGYTHETAGAIQQLAEAAFLVGLVGYTLGFDAGLVGSS
ncbi:MAG: adenosylcobinamide-GDP ribazoletransferase [Burkholderiales bacterium]|nr:MAG: adenosylcobinamide-GDP ribazoletransferase [Burkholderiales bacterium]